MRRQWLHLHSGELSTVAQKLPPVNFWNSQIRQSVNLNDALRAISIFRQMKRSGVYWRKEVYFLLFPFPLCQLYFHFASSISTLPATALQSCAACHF
ncbi:hypothetical protein LINPERPRIM_LOCUS9285 [Linum perenne]